MTPRTVGLLFAIATAIFWGLYGPALTRSRVMGEAMSSPYKAFIFIGLAYLVWGTFGGAAAIKATGGNFSFAGQTVGWGFIAGSLGAFGALTLTFALFKSHAPELVMPVVFGGATMVVVVVNVITSGGTQHIKPVQFVGYGMVIVGIVLIQAYAAHGPAKPAAQSTPAAQAEVASSPKQPQT